MTFNTGNPIGSTDARDRSDNSENLDLAVNSLSQTFVDRFGVTRDTLEGIYQKSAYYRAGTFNAGYTLTNNRQTLAYGNVEYSWSGAFPKVVVAGATPATSGGIGAGAWVDRTDLMLRSEIESGDYLTANLIKKSDGETLEYSLLTRFRPLSNSADAINAAAQLAITNKGALDLTGVTQWSVNKTLILTNVPVIIASLFSPLVFDVAGTYTNGWAVEIGDPSGTFESGRSDGTVIIGTLFASASARTTALNGIYMKGSWFNVGHVRANNFNGTGIYQDSVWDSTFDRISTELCGNTSTYALRIASNGDTHNASHINSVQVEQAYHKAMYIDAIRDVIDNIHAERCYQLTTNDGSSNIDGTTYLNSYILLGNSVIHQAVIDSATVDAPTGEPIVAGQKYKIIINGNASAIKQSAIDGAVYHTYGADFVFENMSTADFIQKYPAERFNLISPNIITLLVEGSGTISSGNIYNVRSQFNAADIAFFDTKIDNITFVNQIAGNISFTNCQIRLIEDLLAKSLATKKHTSFLDCLIQEYVGGYNSICIVNGGKITSGNISTQAKPVFFNVEFDTFNPTGNSGYLTRGCTAATVNAWTYPQNVNYPAGTVTERVGYNAAGKIYQNTDGGINWSAIA